MAIRNRLCCCFLTAVAMLHAQAPTPPKVKAPTAAGATGHTGATGVKVTSEIKTETPKGLNWTWQEVVRGDAVIAVENATAKAQKITAALTEFDFVNASLTSVTNKEAGVTVIGSAASTLPSKQIALFRLTGKDDAPIRPGLYTAFWAVERDGVFAVPEKVTITIPAAKALATEDIETLATRSYPLGKWSSEIKLPLVVPVASDRTGLKDGATIGVLRRDGCWGHALITWNQPKDSQKETELPLTVTGLEEPGLYKGAVNLPGGAATVSVLATDKVIYPALTIFLGILLGSAIKRWINIGRTLRLFGRNVAQLALDFASTNDDFNRRVSGTDYSNNNISADFEVNRQKLTQQLGTLRLIAAPLDSTNVIYQKALADLESLRTVAEGWPGFASDLASLSGTLKSIATANTASPAGAQNPASAILTNSALLNGGVMTLPAYADQRNAVQAASALAAHWNALLARILIDRDLVAALNPTVPAAAADPDRILLGLSSPEPAFSLLWSAVDESALGRVDADLSRNEDTLEALRKKFNLPASAPAPVNDSFAQDFPDSDPQTKVKRLDATIQLGDWLAFVIAVVAGVLSGLAANYFDKPFGTLGDYFKVLLWGLGSKAIVDMATLGIDKATQAVTGKPAAS